MKKLKIGDLASMEKIFSQEEVNRFAEISGDSNPVHFDKEYAGRTLFKQPIVHGMLTASLFGGLFGSTLPGKGTIYLGQNLTFLKPVFVGEEVKATIEVTKIRKDKPIFTFSTKCFNQNEDLVIDGEATMMYKGEFFT